MVRKSISVLLMLIMIVSIITMIPVSAETISDYPTLLSETDSTLQDRSMGDNYYSDEYNYYGDCKADIASRCDLSKRDAAVSALSNSIPNDAVKFNEHYYKAYNTSLTWNEAKDLCKSMGGHLMTITSKAEQELLARLGLSKRTNYWLGGTDANKEGSWYWITGEKWSYTAWEDGMPDNSQMNTGIDEDYLQLCVDWGYLWNDSADTQDHTAGIGYICEWDNLPTGISISKTSLEIEEGKTAKLSATVRPSDASDLKVTWTSNDDSVAEVSDDGTVFANKVGNTVITAKTSNGFYARCRVTVIPKVIYPTDISLSLTDVTIKVGQEHTLTAMVLPPDTTYPKVKWTSDNNNVAEVDASGKVTGVAEGITVIRAKTCNNIEACCTVTVEPVTVEYVKLNRNEVTLEIGDTIPLSATVIPDDAASKELVWTSGNEDIATVTQNGVVTAKSGGRSIITAKASNGVYDTCVVNVKYDVIYPTCISLSEKTLSLNPGDTYLLEATVEPSDAEDKSVEWKSTAPSVVSVQNGSIVAKKVGDAKITATTCNGLVSTCEIIVRVFPKSITLSKGNMLMYKGDSSSLTATVLPTNVTDDKVTWSTSNSKVAIYENGKVTAVDYGTAVITARASNGLSAKCNVTVSERTAEYISLNKTRLYLTEKDGETLVATITPKNAENKSIKWTSSQTSVAEVLSNGYVYGRSFGVTTITATLPNGRSATCEVTVGPYDEETDNSLIEIVKKYTSDNPVVTYNAYVADLDCSNEEKLKLLNELYQSDGFTDAQEGIKYFRESDPYRNDYQYLTNNDVYCAYNFYNWLKNTPRGKAAQITLYADGLVYNNELTSFLDISTYLEKDYPGVKKCKKFLREFMEAELSKCEALDYSKKIGKAMKNTLKINRMLANNVAEEYGFTDIIKKVEGSTDDETRNKWIVEFSLKMASYKEEKNIQKITYWGKEISDAFGYANAFISFGSSTADDIYQLLNLEEELTIYRQNIDFLYNIYNCSYISKDMRAAAKYLIDELDYGYLERIKSLLGNVFTLEKDILSVNTVLWEEAFGSVGGAYGEGLATLKISTVISNLMIPMDDFVKNAAYVQGSAEIAAMYANILVQDKLDFQKKPNSPNAWQFYRDYSILWELRIYGERKYIDLNEINTIVGKSAVDDYIQKGDIVKYNIEKLYEKQFDFAKDYPLSESHHYKIKTVINCPVNVNVYTKYGELVTTLVDGVESDFDTFLCRASVIKQSYSGEYAKVIASDYLEDLTIEIIGTADGTADISRCTLRKISYLSTGAEAYLYRTNAIPIKEDTRIEFTAPQYDYDAQIDYSYDYKGDGTNVNEKSLSPFDTYKYDAVVLLKTDQDTRLELTEDAQKCLSVSASPSTASQNIKWYSSDNDIVSVDRGLITAKRAGTAVVTAVSMDNQDAQLQFTITVNKPSGEPEIFDELISSSEYPEYKYRIIDDGTAQLAQYRYRGISGEIVIPSSIDGHAVSSIGSSIFRGNRYLVKVTIPESVTRIETAAFTDCPNLVEIDLPEKLKYIGSSAFAGCSQLSSFSLPNGLEEIGSGIVSYTSYDQDPENWNNGALYIGTYLLNVDKSYTGDFSVNKGTRIIASSAFSDCSKVTHVNIPDSVIFIGDWAFYGCKSLEELPAFPRSITRIGKYTFSFCTGLTAIDIPDHIRYIGSDAFNNCSKLISITLPNDLIEIGSWAFANCFSLKELHVSKSVRTIGVYAFGYKYTYDNVYNLNRIPVLYENRTIYGFNDSAASEYAKENNIAFVSESINGVFGDVDGDGRVDITDATLIQKAVAELIELDDTQKKSADTNADGMVNITDATMIQKFVAELIDHLG